MAKKRKGTAASPANATAGPPDAKRLIAELKGLIEAARSGVAQAANSALVLLYWQVGSRIRVEVLRSKRASYGERILPTLSAKLVPEYGQGFGERNLARMVRFADVFPDRDVVLALSRELGWSHFVELIPMGDALKRDFYAEMCRVERWSVRTLLGLTLVVLFGHARRGRGLSDGRTESLDDLTLYSERLKLTGRPDRIVRAGERLIPEEWKSAKRVSEGHRLQVGTYFLLIEEQYGVRPPFGVVVLGDGRRVEVKNPERLRSKVLAIAEEIRERRRALREEIPVRQPAAKCRVCGQRGNCGRKAA
jgi:hypothetical protein